jgi:dihydroxyacetone kinase-like protein
VSVKKFVNDPDDLVTEALAGLVRASGGALRLHTDPVWLASTAEPGLRRVALVSGGGSGHEPLHTGFVGPGMLDAAVPGAVFASPTALQVVAAVRGADRGAGVLLVVKNYTGDVLNFAIAAEVAAEEGIEVETVLVDDDLATDPGPDGRGGPGRRGTAATVVVEKVCGAAAARGLPLAEVAALGRRVVAGARSMAVALEGAVHPGEDVRSFDLADDEVELGVGIHGERGTSRRTLAPARELVAVLVEPLVEALGLADGDGVVVVVNGLGSTHLLELSLVFGEVAALLDARGIAVRRSLVGPYVTALDMAGASVTLVRADDELLDLWDAPVTTAALTWGAR